MAARRKATRDIEKDYPRHHFIAKLRRLADCLEQDKPFRIQIAGERVVIPAGATINLEHECAARAEEVEFQLKWSIRG